MSTASSKLKPSPLSELSAIDWKASELCQHTRSALPIVPANPGYFRIFIEHPSVHGSEAFEPILDPIIAWRIDYYAVPVTADEFDEQDGSYAILHPSGRITYPFVGEFASLIQLANYVERLRRRRSKQVKKRRQAELIAN